ncbi:MAG: lysophospholipid acyltransferase family protein [Thermodesulfovibrionales bacterium]|nr:lysophospholipid acyltransferase family protein [Thermodesulfovibrionales bacterium]
MNLYFYTFFILFSIMVIPALTLFVAFLAIFIPHRYAMKRFRRAISWYGRVMTLIPFPLIKIHYEDHSKNNSLGCPHSGGFAEENESYRPGPYIFVSNHRSSSDPFLMCVLPHEAIQIVNVWPFNIPVLGIYARLAGYLNVNQMPSGLFFDRALKLLQEKVSIIFFPEGTRSGGKEMGNFHGSAFRLALQAQAPIVPICISGDENIPPKGSLLLRPGTIRVRRLPAILWDDYKDMNVFLLKNRVREIISRELSLMENGI